MLTSPTFSTPKHPSTTPSISSLIFPPATSHAEHQHRNFNTATTANVLTSHLTASSKSGQLPSINRSSSLLSPLSPPFSIPEIHQSAHTVSQNKNVTLISNSNQNLYFTSESLLQHSHRLSFIINFNYPILPQTFLCESYHHPFLALVVSGAKVSHPTHKIQKIALYRHLLQLQT